MTEIAIAPKYMRKRRHLLSLNQYEAADLAGVHKNTIQKWEREGVSIKEIKRAKYILGMIEY